MGGPTAGNGAKENAKKRVGQTSRTSSSSEASPWTGGKPDARQQAYLDKVLDENAGKVAQAKPGGRNDALYLAALKCGSFMAGAGMDVEPVGARLEAAAGACGLMEDDGPQSVYATMASGFKIGIANPRSVPAQRADGDGGQRREIEWTLLEDIEDAAPKWAWTYDGLGRIQIAALTLFGGRPTAGKSTAARWFAARLSGVSWRGAGRASHRGSPTSPPRKRPGMFSSPHCAQPGPTCAGSSPPR